MTSLLAVNRPRSGLRPLLLSAAALLVGSCADAAPPAAPRPPSHLVLVTVDTWRGDHLLASRGGVELNPELRRWAPRALRYSAHSSAGSETSPGVASIFTGLLPTRSGVLANRHMLQEHVPALPALLARQGFATAGFVANPVLRAGTGFEGGFDRFELVDERPPARKARAGELVDRGLRWLDGELPAARRFLWLHLMEPHGPYQPEPWARERLALDAFGPARPVPLLPAPDNTGRGGIPAYQHLGSGAASADARDYELRYAAEVLSCDAALGRLLDELERRGLLADALVVVTSDHGEALTGEHGFYFSHGHGLTEDQIHVPLLLLAPGLAPGERVYPTSSVDLLPTVLRLLGASPAGLDLDGQDVLAGPPAAVFAERMSERMARRGPWKLHWLAAARPALFHLGRDPAEAVDLAGVRERRVGQLMQELRRTHRPALARPVNRPRRSREDAAALRALGYL